MRRFRELLRNRKGAAAIEFAILALPFIVVVLAVLEIAIMFFVDSGLDAALHKTVRQVRVGSAKASAWDLAKFKARVCDELSYSFSCSANLKVRSIVITNMNSVTRISPIQNGNLVVTEDFDIGNAGDYVLVQAFLPWDPMFKLYAISGGRLNDGRYVLGASELFKNEPF
jgi:Flp pilus assembly protein TadG